MNHEGLAVDLIEKGVLQTPHIIRAFEAIDRKDFVPEDLQSSAYSDVPLPIGHGQTISQPYTVAFMLELLQPEPGQRVLDVGSGSGWTTALLARIVGPHGIVVGTEIVSELALYGESNLRKYSFPNADIRLTASLGAPEDAPFDRILVSAAAREVPQPLIDQLNSPGIMAMPAGNAIYRIKKDAAERLETERYEGFAFVPLIT